MAQQCKVWIDKNLISSTKGIGELLTDLEKSNVTTIIEKLPVDNSILWTRCDTSMSKEDKTKVKNLYLTKMKLFYSHLLQLNEVQHDHILVKIEIENIIEYITDFHLNSNPENSNISSCIKSVKNDAQVSQITFLILNLKALIKYKIYIVIII